MVWYFPSFSELSTVHCDPHKDFGVVNKAEVGVYLEFFNFFDGSMMLDIDLWFLCIFYIQLEHLEVCSSLTVEALAWRIFRITLLSFEMCAIV